MRQVSRSIYPATLLSKLAKQKYIYTCLQSLIIQLLCFTKGVCLKLRNAPKEKRLAAVCVHAMDYQGKWVKPSYRSSTQGNPSLVIFSYGTQFVRVCYSRDAWTAEATFSKLSRRDGGNVIVYALILYHSWDVFCTLTSLCVRPSFGLFCTRLAVYSSSGS